MDDEATLARHLGRGWLAMADRPIWRRVADRDDLERVCRIGRLLADMLGIACAGMEAGEPFSVYEMTMARAVLLMWQEIQAGVE